MYCSQKIIKLFVFFFSPDDLIQMFSQLINELFIIIIMHIINGKPENMKDHQCEYEFICTLQNNTFNTIYTRICHEYTFTMCVFFVLSFSLLIHLFGYCSSSFKLPVIMSLLNCNCPNYV